MIVYKSRTGNVKNIVGRVIESDSSIKVLNIDDVNDINEDYVLITYTDGLGNIPESVIDFLKCDDNRSFLKAVIISGNINFGNSYCLAGNKISEIYSVPFVHKIDLRGNSKDIEVIIEQYNKIIKNK